MTIRHWAVLTIGLLGCAHEATAPASAPASAAAAQPSHLPESARYFPLAVGNRWTYQATYLGERSTRQVELVAFRDGSYVDRDGRALRFDGEGLRDQVRYLLHDPLAAGATWTSVVAPGAAEQYRVLSAHEACETPAGRFPDCVVVESRATADPTHPGRVLVNRVTFAAGVGIVRVRTELVEGQRTVPTAELVLTAFQVLPLR